ncbi:DUF2066 domain-containing protein [Alteromonas sp. B31-7]|jgi:uncharacterized protein|uniref:DUF2066 domain-containing protein n=1 Tax=Alteromonas sp. B31-7 TaxID=2785913 RepID=UPI0018CB2E2F|nr:DUF2066 domain-containing protein [Alteromonas sp. B31-7]QPL48386.1 DUF2066 domain-containing protein [Alteromonas sp. B31-7]
MNVIGVIKQLISLRKGSVRGCLGFWATSIVLSALVSGHVEATQVIQTNIAAIAVDDQSQRSQDSALKSAFKQVMIKITGNKDALQNPGVKAALRTPQAYLRSYRFDFQEGETLYVAEFDKIKLNELLQREGLPLWGERRPETLLWMATEDSESGERQLLDETTPSEMREHLSAKAKERGLPLSFPLMDLTDRSTISIYDVWGRFVQSLTQASNRYSVDNVIGARVYKNEPGTVSEVPGETARLEQLQLDATRGDSQDLATADLNDNPVAHESDYTAESAEQPYNTDAMSEAGDDDSVEGVTNVSMPPFTMDEFTTYAQRAEQGDYALDWVFVGGGKVSYGSIFADDPATLASLLVDAYSNYLSAQYAIIPGASDAEKVTITVSIANVNSVTSYANATAYLNSLSVVDSAALIQQEGSVATYTITLLGSAQDLINTVRLENKLRPVTDVYGQVVESYTFYWGN